MIFRNVAIESGRYDSMKNLMIPFQIKVSSKYFLSLRNLGLMVFGSMSAIVKMKLPVVINSIMKSESVSLMKSVDPKFIISKYSSFGLEYSESCISFGAISLMENS